MMEKYIKIGSSILDNFTVGPLPDHLWRRVIELALMTAIQDKGGELPDLPIMAWYLRSDEAALLKALKELSAQRITQQNTDGSWSLRIYNRFQQISNSSDRVRRYRARRIENGMGVSPGYDQEAIKRRDNYTCVYCEARANLCVDHIYPISQGGTDDYRNLACACQTCNSGKAGRTPEQAGFTFANHIARERYEDYKADMEFIVPT
jgi:5-methylcytosine-specific restriction endonuclease McrA